MDENSVTMCASISVSEDRLEPSVGTVCLRLLLFYHCVPVEFSEIHSCHELNRKEMETRVSKVNKALKISSWMSKDIQLELLEPQHIRKEYLLLLPQAW